MSNIPATVALVCYVLLAVPTASFAMMAGEAGAGPQQLRPQRLTVPAIAHFN